jgi:hypothetical protein
VPEINPDRSPENIPPDLLDPNSIRFPIKRGIDRVLN